MHRAATCTGGTPRLGAVLPLQMEASDLISVQTFQFVCLSAPGSVRFRIGFVSPQVKKKTAGQKSLLWGRELNT